MSILFAWRMTAIVVALFVVACCCSGAATGRLVIEPFGPNTIRVRATAHDVAFNDRVPSAVAGFTPGVRSRVADVAPGVVQSGDLIARVSNATGLVAFYRASDGALLLEELGRMVPRRSNTTSAPASVRFSALPSDLIYGLGQGIPVIPYPTLRPLPLNRKGWNVSFNECVANEGGAANCLPWHTVVRNQSAQRGDGTSTTPQVAFGFLWNVPSMGGLHFADTHTDWWSHAAFQLDYLVTVPNATDRGTERFDSLQAQYTALVGRSMALPSSLLGYWHSKNAYRNQTQVLTAMAGFRERGIPVDVFIIDIGGSRGKIQGDWAFDPSEFPDPSNMTAELAKTSTRVMVSVWAGTDVGSSSWETLVEYGWVVRNKSAASFTPLPWPIGCRGPQCYLYDASNADARRYVWSRIKAGYVAHNITLFWLDASEPQPPIVGIPWCDQFTEGAYSVGSVHEVGMAFTQWHTGTFREGFLHDGLDESVMLARSGWFGTSAHGAALWSGDTLSSWLTLEVSIRTGLGAQLSGIAWWTTDVGGYRLPDIHHMPQPELVVRWFQFGLTCPLLRQHGHRPETVPWAYGPVAGPLIADIIRQRHAMKPYLREAHDALAATGKPFNRPLWWDFPDDPEVWQLPYDQYMFGPSLLAAPVVTDGARSRLVYLPAGSTWRHYYTNATYDGGAWHNISAPLDHFPLLWREAA